MYFPIGWPKVLNVPKCKQRQNDADKFKCIVCNRDRVLFAILSNHSLSIFFCKPCVPITCHTRDVQSVQDFGENSLVQWKPDSSMLVVSTSLGYLIFYKLDVDSSVKSGTGGNGGLYEQIDSPQPNLVRENVQLFTKETIPGLKLSVMTQVAVPGSIPALVGIRDELMVTSSSAQVWRYKWDGHLNRDYCLDLRRIPFCMDQLVSKAVPIVESNTFIVDIEYSPLVGGFSVVFNDGRAAFLTASSLKFDPNQTQGLWAPHLDDARCSSLNHKYRLIAFGRNNGQTSVYTIDEHTGGLGLSHSLVVSDKVYTGELGSVCCMRYTPDGRALALSWSRGGFSVWSTFGSLLVCSLAWDYGLPPSQPPLLMRGRGSMEWGVEGYQLWMIRTQDTNNSTGVNDNHWRETEDCNVRQRQNNNNNNKSKKTEIEHVQDEIILYSFVKSVLATNPTMTHQSHLFLQGEDKLYLNFGSGLSRLYTMCEQGPAQCDEGGSRMGGGPQCDSVPSMGLAGPTISSSLVENKQCHVVSLPATYAATNWPIRLAAIDSEGKHLAVAGRCGIAHYSLLTRKWKLFGNETQEKDMVVFGGLLWFARSWIVLGCYSIPTETDELRFYPKEPRLSNESMISVSVSGQVCLLENLRNRILTFTSDCRIYIYNVEETGTGLDVTHIQSIDVSGLCVHPACIVSITLTTILPEPAHRSSSSLLNNSNNNRHPSNQSPGRGKDSFVMNVSGRLLLVNQFDESQEVAAPTVLASNVETVWAPSPSHPTPRARPHLTQALWLYCGVQGMRVWLPLFPRQNNSGPSGGSTGSGGPGSSQYSNHHHSFISKRIMLPFQLNVYPLGILYEEAILLGVENDAALYSTADPRSVFSLPFSLLKRTSQVYIHQILRQLIRRNLGYHAWEIARACTSLPYFPHSLELLLHEVLEEEATSKEPIPDAQLPSVIEFIQEFPVYLSTIVQCARKTEIALWGYLFAAAGKPKDLFQQCLTANELETAASYLIILQNLETSSVSRQYATLLLDATLDAGQWDLAKDLVRFLRAIDPNDIEQSPRTSVIHHNYKYGTLPGVTPLSPSLTPNEEDLSMLLGTMQVSRARSYSTTNTPKIELQPMLPTSNNTRHTDNTNKHNESIRTRKRSNTSNKSDKESTTNGARTGTAEDFFMDLILQRHARRLLVNHELKSFGHFAATLDFHLVEWLLKERSRAARVDSFIVALKNLHACFEWPYPNYSTDWVLGGGGGSVSAMSRNTSLSSMRSTSPPASPDEPLFKFGPLGIKHSDTPLPGLVHGAGPGSLIDDSGYMSQNPVLQVHSGNCYVSPDARSLLSDDTITNSYYPAPLAVRAGPTSPSSYRGECEDGMASPWLSPPSWLNGGGEDEGGRGEETQNHSAGGREWTVAIPCTQVLDALSKQMTSRGSPKAEVQLRYLLQIFTEAGCLEWTFIIAVLLRDAMAIHRISNAARSPDQSYESVLLLKEGFVSLCRWSHSECLGYKPFFVAVQAQLSILNKVLTLKQPPLSSGSSSPLLTSTSPPNTSSTSNNNVLVEGELPLLSSSGDTDATANSSGNHGNKKSVATGAIGSGHVTSGECKSSGGAEQGEGEEGDGNETPSVCVVM